MDNIMEVKNEAKLLGRHIVADPHVCHGQPTFLGTRIFVEDVLDQVASGMGSNPVSPIHWLFLDLIFPTPEHIDIDVRASGRLALL
jgi:hypothetical protein